MKANWKALKNGTFFSLYVVGNVTVIKYLNQVNTESNKRINELRNKKLPISSTSPPLFFQKVAKKNENIDKIDKPKKPTF